MLEQTIHKVGLDGATFSYKVELRKDLSLISRSVHSPNEAPRKHPLCHLPLRKGNERKEISDAFNEVPRRASWEKVYVDISSGIPNCMDRIFRFQIKITFFSTVPYSVTFELDPFLIV